MIGHIQTSLLGGQYDHPCVEVRVCTLREQNESGKRKRRTGHEEMAFAWGDDYQSRLAELIEQAVDPTHKEKLERVSKSGYPDHKGHLVVNFDYHRDLMSLERAFSQHGELFVGLPEGLVNKIQEHKPNVLILEPARPFDLRLRGQLRSIDFMDLERARREGSLEKPLLFRTGPRADCREFAAICYAELFQRGRGLLIVMTREILRQAMITKLRILNHLMPYMKSTPDLFPQPRRGQRDTGTTDADDDDDQAQTVELH